MGTCPKSEVGPLSAVILNHETLYQKSDTGVPLLELAKDLDIVPGVTLDRGWVDLGEGEVFTQGLDSEGTDFQTSTLAKPRLMPIDPLHNHINYGGGLGERIGQIICKIQRSQNFPGCEEYKKLGCQFAKWRMVVNIGKDIPSLEAIKEGARGLAMYAKICQRNGLVPIIEPDI